MGAGVGAAAVAGGSLLGPVGAGIGAALAAGGSLLAPMLGRGGVLTDTASRALRIATDSELPTQADVVVVGAGVIGVCSALYLAERGFSVVICEKGVVAGEQSSRAFGWVTNHGVADEIQGLAVRSKTLWHGMDRWLDDDTGFRANGYLQLCSSDEEIGAAEAWIESLRGRIDSQAKIISGAELATHAAGSTSAWKAALYQADDGGIESATTASVLARAARKRGVKIVESCAVRGIETEAGRVSAVVTERGVVTTLNLLVAGGAWSRLLLGSLDVELPLLAAYLSQQRTTPVAGPAGCGFGGPAAWRRELDGSYSLGAPVLGAPVTPDSFRLIGKFLPTMRAMREMGEEMNLALTSDFFRALRVPKRWALDRVSPFERARVLAPTPDHGLLDKALASMAEEFPVFREARVAERWGGIINVAPDFNPIVDTLPTLPGAVVASGFAFGMTLAPAVGELVADIISGSEPKVDRAPLKLSRF
ncbi:NAD(P)/FAD-dependent oxidoreductase [Pseudomonas sp. LRF_L74]|uniref:NAD(P)/FAD-dependent oxidoreductase n=1 Tax=Pseudomonas sp. LRF_L74 TaxID=3369422 RepID=UPI003F61FC01